MAWFDQYELDRDARRMGPEYDVPAIRTAIREGEGRAIAQWNQEHPETRIGPFDNVGTAQLIAELIHRGVFKRLGSVSAVEGGYERRRTTYEVESIHILPGTIRVWGSADPIITSETYVPHTTMSTGPS